MSWATQLAMTNYQIYKMSIGLYGDSYGCGSLGQWTRNGMKYHWSTLLKQELDIKLTNYSLSGASIYYCYKKFLKFHHLHDTIIFLISWPDRYFKSVNLPSIGGVQNIVSYEHIVNIRTTCRDVISKEDDVALNDLNGWYKMGDLDYNEDICGLILDSILRIRPDTIFVPCFGYPAVEKSDFLKKQGLFNGQNLTDLYNHQIINLNVMPHSEKNSHDENSNYISGHLTPEYNEIFYKIISERLKTGKWNWKMPDRVEFGENVKDYYTELKL